MPASLSPTGGHVRRRTYYWPTPEQELLLRAALLPGEPALDAWHTWRAQVDVDQLDAGCLRLLPLLAHNLKRLAVRDDPELARCHGLQRYVWAANQRKVTRLAPAIDALASAGVPTMLLKGMALVRRHYANMGLRAMEDVDLLVPAPDAARASAILQRCGWRVTGPDADPTARHAQAFVDDGGYQVDLHWHALWEYSGSTVDESDSWRRAQQVTFGRSSAWVPADDELFLHVVVHGARWNAVPPVRWVADAMTILSTAGDSFSWPHLIQQAKANELVLPIREALAFLARTFDAAIPSNAIEQLSAYQPSRFERVEQRMREWTSPAVGCFPLKVCHHVRVNRHAGAVAVASRLPRYLQHAYGVPRLRLLPGRLWNRVSRRLRDAAGVAG